MGDWRLEVFRMTIYMTFPVALFYCFNQPQLFEDWVIKTKRVYYPPEDPQIKEQYQALIREKQKQRNQDLLDALEASTARNTSSSTT